MLSRLSIRNIVLIEKLDLSLQSGLTVLTGETGAGKSILLDALGLALGHRADAKLLRKGAELGSAVAVFDVPPAHRARQMLDDNGIEHEGEDLILRRAIGDDGRTRAYVNDQPVSVGLLRRVGEQLVEIHGQFETQRLMEPASHRTLLDAFGGNDDALDKTAGAHSHWRDMAASLSAAREAARLASENQDFLRHAVEELEALSPEAGEESALAEKRTMLQHSEQISQAMATAVEALGGDNGVEDKLNRTVDEIERAATKAGGLLDDTLAALRRAQSEAADASGFLERATSDLEIDPQALEAAEERLFALRALARKHNCEVDALADVHARMQRELADIDAGGENEKRLAKEVEKARDGFIEAAGALRERRSAAGKKLDKAMAGELAPLKLGNAQFSTSLRDLPEDKWSALGHDQVAFEVATNPGSAPGPLNKIASGGELARFMLALKVVLAEADPVPVLVFDEVDAGIGGAVAAAVGERLAKLGASVQVLVVTHSPQVAATGNQHFNVRKGVNGKETLTDVGILDAVERSEEIARMLSGEEVTKEARAAAESLLKEAHS